MHASTRSLPSSSSAPSHRRIRIRLIKHASSLFLIPLAVLILHFIAALLPTPTRTPFMLPVLPRSLRPTWPFNAYPIPSYPSHSILPPPSLYLIPSITIGNMPQSMPSSSPPSSTPYLLITISPVPAGRLLGDSASTSLALPPFETRGTSGLTHFTRRCLAPLCFARTLGEETRLHSRQRRHNTRLLVAS
ncbi:hypothetical protein LZ30DRAFT_410229 [Colletotrichum cereale]|nr:hypothetical protein LZ30DRAFT_410229 [Colletotrichum cereale]